MSNETDNLTTDKDGWIYPPAWMALKALTEGTHDVQWARGPDWCKLQDADELSKDDRCRIRQKRRTMDVAGLPVHRSIKAPQHERWERPVIELRYENDSDRDEALIILEAARDAQ